MTIMKKLIVLLSVLGFSLLYLDSSTYACACEGENPSNFFGIVYFFMGIFIFGGITILTLIMAFKIWRKSKRA